MDGKDQALLCEGACGACGAWVLCRCFACSLRTFKFNIQAFYTEELKCSVKTLQEEVSQLRSALEEAKKKCDNKCLLMI